MERIRFKKVKKIVIYVISSVLLLIIIGLIYFFLFMNPKRGTVKNMEPMPSLDHVLSKEQAIKDLDYLYKCISERHPAYLDGSKNLTEALKKQFNIEKNSINSDITVLELWQMTSRITSKLNDAHTSILYNSNDYFVIDSFEELRQYGAPIAINGISIDDLYNRFLSMFSYEIEDYARNKFENQFIIVKESLEFLGINIVKNVTFTFNIDGNEVDYNYEFVNINDIQKNASNDSNEFVSYEIYSTNNLGILTLNSCIYDEVYKSTLNEFFQKISMYKITNIIVDLRSNGGGNSMVANEFIRYLDVDKYNTWDSSIRFGDILANFKNNTVINNKHDVVFYGDVYLLTNISTFSSAMNFAMLIQDNELGIIVGQASGNMPNSYGDILKFQLPNSKLALVVSFKKWYRVDLSKNNLPIIPDYQVQPGYETKKVLELINNDN